VPAVDLDGPWQKYLEALTGLASAASRHG
jgi:hypothetical protein